MVYLNSLTRKVQKLEDLRYLKTEMDLREKLRQTQEADRTKRQLSHASRSNDTELIDRLFAAGFTAETLPALSLAPIALVAWGSGYVTNEERAVAMQAVYDSEVSGNRPAVAMFHSWLETRPDPELLSLWADFTKDQIRSLRPGTQEAYGIRMVRLANHVALASGGFLGFGSICTGEQDVIDFISDVNQCMPH